MPSAGAPDRAIAESGVGNQSTTTSRPPSPELAQQRNPRGDSSVADTAAVKGEIGIAISVGHRKWRVLEGFAREIAAEPAPFLDLRHSAGVRPHQERRSQRVIESPASAAVTPSKEAERAHRKGTIGNIPKKICGTPRLSGRQPRRIPLRQPDGPWVGSAAKSPTADGCGAGFTARSQAAALANGTKAAGCTRPKSVPDQFTGVTLATRPPWRWIACWASSSLLKGMKRTVLARLCRR